MLKPVENYLLVIKNESIKQGHQTEFLGVMMDVKLTWCEHVQYIECKIANEIDIVSKANYCIEVWGDTFKTQLQTLVKLQKRVLSFSRWNAFVDHLY